MPVFDWQSQEVYERARQEAEITGFAWECLRRNPHYQREHDEITGHDHGVTADFRRRWGVCFRGCPGRVLSRTNRVLGAGGLANGSSRGPGAAAIARHVR